MKTEQKKILKQNIKLDGQGGIGDFFSSMFKPSAPVPVASAESLQTPKPAAPVFKSSKNDKYSVDSEDWGKLAPLVYGEISNRKEPGKQELETRVILNTILNRQKEYAKHGQQKKLSEIVAMPAQYQAYGSKNYKAYSDSTLPMDVAKRNTVNSLMKKMLEEVQTGRWKDNTNNAFYYQHNPDNTITYDDLRKLYK